MAKQRSPRIQTSVDESRRNKVEFIEALRGNKQLRLLPLSVRAACDRVGVSRMTVRRWRADDLKFAAAYDDAMEDGADVLEDAAVTRAVDGVPRDVYYMGEVVGREQQYSDGLLQFLLQGRRAALYRPNSQVNTQVNLIQEAPSDRDVAKALALVIEEMKAKQLEDAT